MTTDDENAVAEAMLSAIRAGEEETIRQIVAKDPNALTVPLGRSGRAALGTALWYRSLIPLLLELGADPNAPVARGRDHPLCVAFTNRHLDTVRQLAEHGATFASLAAYPDAVARVWSSVLQSGNVAAAKLIFELEFDLLAYERDNGSLFVNAIAGYDMVRETGVIELLLERGMDLNITGYRERTPLLNALRIGRVDVAELFLARGARIDHPRHREQSLLALEGSPLLSADTLRAVVAQGMDPNARADDELGGCTIAHLVITSRANPAQLEVLKSLGVDLNAGDNRGNTPLMYCFPDSQQYVEPLLAAGVDLTVRNCDGKTALDICRGRKGQKRIAAKLEKALGTQAPESVALGVTLEAGEPWAAHLQDQLRQLEDARASDWQALLRLAADTDSTKPTKTFHKKSDELIDKLGADHARSVLLSALAKAAEPRTEGIANEDEYCDDRYLYYGDSRWALTALSTRILRGLLWTLARFDDNETSATLREVARAFYKKVPQVGIRNAKVANGALNALSRMPGTRGLREIAILREQTKYNSALAHINRVFDKLAAEHDLAPAELAEMSASDYGLQRCGEYTSEIGEFVAKLRITGPGRTELTWLNQEGKEQKSDPAAVKKAQAAALKSIKGLAKDLQKATLATRIRLEKTYLEPATWTVPTWRERYIEHPVSGTLGRALIWRFDLGDGHYPSGLWHDGTVIGADGEPIDIETATRVDLWHPLYGEVETVLAWRNRLRDLGIVQPFKQAHREVYLLTDAERETHDHSLRFAGHILRQHIVNALAKERGWGQMLGGHWDGGSEIDAVRPIPGTKLLAVLEMAPEADMELSQAGIYVYASSGQLSFQTRNGTRTALDKIEPMVFSEVLRDVDLFTAAASVANEPDWELRDAFPYWSKAGFGALSESAKTRHAVLAELIPKLKVASQLELDGNFLVVAGKLRTYKIHLGSGNILMEPGSQYLCIVQARDRSKGIYLPFEGDKTLSVILSKALLLVDDTKIKDPVIVAQINPDSEVAANG